MEPSAAGNETHWSLLPNEGPDLARFMSACATIANEFRDSYHRRSLGRMFQPKQMVLHRMVMLL
eukprot:6603169-Lingulodinium_polyedra.AAC.1